MEGKNVGKKGKGHQETCIKDPWTKPKWGRIEGGRWGEVGQWRVLVGKWSQLYLNNFFKSEKKRKKNPNWKRRSKTVIICRQHDSVCRKSHSL